MSESHAPLPANALFAINERVFVADPKQNGMIYEAKILKHRENNDGSNGTPKNQYFIHYNNWNTRWDTWVDEAYILKFNEENQQKADIMAQKARDGELKATGATRSRPARATTSKKRKRDGKDDDNNDNYDAFQIPPALRRKLVEDSSLVTQSKQLIPLPRSPSVAEIISEFYDHTNEKNSQIKSALDALRHLFDEEIGTRLLYRFERIQLRHILKKHPRTPLSEIYGAEHLLRLFVHLAGVLGQCDISSTDSETIRQIGNDLLKFLSDNVHTFFLNEYEQPPLDYMKEAGLQ